MAEMALDPTPVTIITGFLGSGKTTLILNLIPQLPADYRLALLKNEFGDLAVDSQLARSNSISGVRELLNGCICCNLVGQLSDALFQLRDTVSPNRIVIETSGSAFPATLAMEVNRISREHQGTFTLDGVISVIDVENWKGYDDTSYTAKMQAKYTDLIVFNKWELVGEDAFDRCLDRVGDLEVQIAWVKSVKGRVDKEVVLGIDGALVAKTGNIETVLDEKKPHTHDHKHGEGEHEHRDDHQWEVEVLSVTLKSQSPGTAGLRLDDFEDLLLAAPKDEVYRIKGLIASADPPPDSRGERRASLTLTNAQENSSQNYFGIYVLNWAFGRWTYTSLPPSSHTTTESGKEVGDGNILQGASARLTLILARGEATKWKRKLEDGDYFHLDGDTGYDLKVEKVN